MNKFDYLSAVQERLLGLPEADIERSLDYYIEMIDDRMEEGMSEEDAVAAMGSPEEAAQQILLDAPLSKVLRAKVRPERALRAWEIVLLVLGSPIWLPLLLTAACLLLLVYLLIWTAALVLWSIDLSFAAAALGGVFCVVPNVLDGQLSGALLLLGGGLVCAGLAILMFFVCRWASRGILHLSRRIGRWLKSRFIRKGESV